MPCTYVMESSRGYSTGQLYAYWTGAGGSSARGAIMVAIALAESCGDPFATSPTCNRGLWQIGDANAEHYGFQTNNMYDAAANAYVAVQLSNNGDNIAAWDVAYTAGEGLTRLQYLHDLQPGSAAALLLPGVQAALGQPGGVGGGGGAGLTPGFPGGIAIAPQQPGEPPVPGTVVPIAPVIPNYPDVPNVLEPGNRGDGWDNMRAYIGYDLPNIYALDQALRNAIFLPERQG